MNFRTSLLISVILVITASKSKANLCPWDLPDLHLWSDFSTWEGGKPPEEGDSFILTKKVLLDIETPSLGTIRIIDGGMIIFSPNHQVKLTADSILVMRNGSLIVGNPDCVYERDTEIILTGDRKEMPDPTFGYYVKGIYVGEGGNLDFHGQEKLSWTKLAETLIPIQGKSEYIIKLVDQPFGWLPGDKLVIASTDFDMYQAEEVELLECEFHEFQFSQCLIRADLNFTHYGKIYKDVDMRAEVGLLSRNIKIYGHVNDENDSFGGHIKAFYGFETYRIQGVELTKMGQRGIKGRYPIHWHMAKETNPEKTYVKDNSIHHVFQRCVTVHGTHNVNVANNVAYHTYGHCYFVEDGGEKNNTFHHNLGLLTQRMTPSISDRNGTIPSDRLPATFWITSPLTVMTQNSAAGSDGMGIWYIFANEVTGPSATEGFFEEGEAERTPILTFDTNTAHSNQNTGFFFGSELQPDQDFIGMAEPGGGQRCDPRKYPKDPYSEEISNLVKDLTTFKNRQQNVWMVCRRTTFDGFKSSDAQLGYTQSVNADLINSIFIGESDNFGEPNIVRLRNGTKVLWYRSTPHENGNEVLGLQLYDGNPYVSGNRFSDFIEDEFKVTGAIGFRKPHAGEPPTLFKRNFFDFVDGEGGNYIRGNERFTYGGGGASERMGQIFDWDGTITGIPKSMVVRNQPFYTSSLCEPRPHWGNMSICPHRYVTAEGSGNGYGDLKMVITRDDIPQYPEISLIYPDPWHPKLSTNHSYIYSFPNNSLPSDFNIRLVGLDSGHSVLVGICIHLNADEDQIILQGTPKPMKLTTYNDLLNDRTGAGYYWDQEVGAIFRRFQVDLGRDPEIRQGCLPDGHCPSFVIKTNGADGDTDCTDRAYPKYQKDPL